MKKTYEKTKISRSSRIDHNSINLKSQFGEFGSCRYAFQQESPEPRPQVLRLPGETLAMLGLEIVIWPEIFGISNVYSQSGL